MTGILFCLGLLCSQSALAGLRPGTNLGPIPDGLPGGPARYGPPRDVYFDISEVRTVTFIQVEFTITHPFVGDLRVTLIAPDGNSHLLFARTGATSAGSFGFPSELNGTYNFFDISTENWWTGAAINPVPASSYRSVIAGGAGASNPPATTSINAQFAGSATNGRWILRFEDGAVTDTGTVTAATLSMIQAGGVRLVNNANDSGAGSLRAAMLAATTGDVIQFDPSAFNTAATLNLLSPLPVIDKVLAIQGPGADRFTVRREDDAEDMRIFTILSGLSGVSVTGLTVSNGRSTLSGGGIISSSPLTLSGVHLHGNRANFGGGLSMTGRGQIISSTFSGNRAIGSAALDIDGIERVRIERSTFSGNVSTTIDPNFTDGAIRVFASGSSVGTLTISGCTIAENIAQAAITASGTGATVQLHNSIVANNGMTNFNRGSFMGATFQSLGFNLSDNYNGAMTLLTSDLTGDPRLGPLAPQGGTVPVHLLLGGSPALDRGSSAGPVADQRGRPTPFDIGGIANEADGGNGSDIGAVEMQALIVSSASDSGANTLRAAINEANNNSALADIIFDPVALGGASFISLSTALPTISSPLTISGPGADSFAVRRGGGTPAFRLFTINADLPVVALSGLKLQGGNSAGGDGGAIRSASPLTLAGMHLLGNLSQNQGGAVYLTLGGGTFVDSTFNGNTAGQAGAISSFGVVRYPLRLINSTVSGNTATGNDGGILHRMDLCCRTSILEIINSTITLNSGAGSGGVASVALGSGGNPGNALVRLRNSIIAGNSAPNLVTFANGGATASFTSDGYNLSNTAMGAFLNHPTDQNSANAGLGPLQLNGGSTPTHALLSNSAALDAGDNSGSGVQYDQRGPGFVRTAEQPLVSVGDGTDIGAYELRSEIFFVNGFE
jgi:subtilisin-like proprotein convertase family protein